MMSYKDSYGKLHVRQSHCLSRALFGTRKRHCLQPPVSTHLWGQEERTETTPEIKISSHSDRSELHRYQSSSLLNLLLSSEDSMDSSLSPNAVLSVLSRSGMDSPPTILRELLEQSEPEPRQPTELGSIQTLGPVIPGFGTRYIDADELSRLVNEAATYPGNQTTFISTKPQASESTSKPVSVSEELDAHIFNRRLLIKLYDADHPNPEACPNLKPVKWKTEKNYASFANEEDRKKLKQIKALDYFVAGSVARRQSRKAQQDAVKDETTKKFEAIRSTWAEPMYKDKYEYLDPQNEFTEQLCSGKVELAKPQSQNATLRLPRDISSHLSQARDLQMQDETAKRLVVISDLMSRTQGAGNLVELNQMQTKTASQLVTINSMTAKINSTNAPIPEMPTSSSTAPQEAQTAPTSCSQTATAQPVRGFQGINWQDVRPFTPAQSTQAMTSRSGSGVQQHIDVILQWQTNRQTQTPIDEQGHAHLQTERGGSGAEQTVSQSQYPFIGFYHQSPSDPGWPYY